MIMIRVATRAMVVAAAGLGAVLALLVSCSAAPHATTATPGATPTFRVPDTLSVPDLHITAAPLIQLGLNPDGTVQVPSLDQPLQAGWWVPDHPTADTPIVVLGHVNANGKAGLFEQLTQLKTGAVATVHYADGTSRTFVISKVFGVSKAAFPTAEVYGDQGSPTLRLVTCGGPLDTTAHNYLDNEIAEGAPT